MKNVIFVLFLTFMAVATVQVILPDIAVANPFTDAADTLDKFGVGDNNSNAEGKISSFAWTIYYIVMGLILVGCGIGWGKSILKVVHKDRDASMEDVIKFGILIGVLGAATILLPMLFEWGKNAVK